MKRVIAGLGALILSAVLLVGLPAALIYLAGNPIPSWDRTIQALTTPDYGGEFLIGNVIPILAWLAWGTFAIGYLAEIPNQLAHARRNLRGPRVRVPGLGVQQKAAGVLIAAIIAIVAPTSAFAAPISSAPVPATSFSSSQVSASMTTDYDVASTAPAVKAVDATTYIVQDGDSLWSIAETQLGAGERWEEIHALNKDRPQPGGSTIGERTGVDPGMVLVLPDAAPVNPAPASVEAGHLVQDGETLWSISEVELGDGNRYVELFDASQGTIQADGQRMSDPDVILPGWNVTIPGETVSAPIDVPVTVDEQPAQAVDPVPVPAPVDISEEETASPVEQAAPESGDPSTLGGLGISSDDTASDEIAPAEEPTGSDAAASSTAEASDNAEWIDIVSDWRTIGGVGALLAAGLLSVLGWRRLQQRRSRKPGRRIAMPAADISATELELRAVENPTGTEAIDHALRLLALWAQDANETLPALFALRLSAETVSIFLDEAATLPTPFRSISDDNMAWEVSLEELTPLERIPAAPYPALVTIGKDENEALLLVDLERMGALNVHGSAELQTATLTAIAMELATNTWGDGVRVTLVDVAKDLPQCLGGNRLRYLDDTEALLQDLRTQAKAVERAYAAGEITSIEQARTARVDAESWVPEIVILGRTPDPSVLAEISDLVSRIPRVGIAGVAAGHLSGGWNLRVESTNAAELEIPDAGGAALPLVPQLVDARTYHDLVATFTVADDEEGSFHSVASPEISLVELPSTTPQGFNESPTVESTAETPEPPTEEVVAGSTVEAELSAPRTPDTTEVADVADEDDVTEELAPVVDLHTPRIRLLGPVEVLNAQGQTPTGDTQIRQWNSQVLRATELVAFLATHPKSTTEQVHEAMWRGTDPTAGTTSRNRLTTATRRWLGNDSHNTPYFPHVTSGVYELTGITSDWEDWNKLVGDDPTRASTPHLLKALELVAGQPFSGVKKKYYIWAQEIQGDMIAAIGDAAHELATRALRDGNARLARKAAAIGRTVEPINEIYWRDGLRAEYLAGDHEAVERMVAQLEFELAKADPEYAEMEPDTEELVLQIRARRALVG